MWLTSASARPGTASVATWASHTPADGRAVIKRGLERAGVAFAWRLYDAEHAFGRDIGPRYDPEATDAAFAETVAMLKT